jgi:hypothetical protein
VSHNGGRGEWVYVCSHFHNVSTLHYCFILTCVYVCVPFQEEAEALGDTVAIMSRGQVVAEGSSIELKAAHGVGYHMHAVKRDGACACLCVRVRWLAAGY